MVRTVVKVVSVLAAAVVAAGLGVLIWWLVADHDTDVTEVWIPDIPLVADFAVIPGSGSMFWWFFPSLDNEPSKRPLVLWLDGVTGDPPSLLANFGMFGPYDFNLNRRNDSWVNDCNLLFVDAPLGTGFSTLENNAEINGDLDSNTEHLIQTLESFYSSNKNFADSPLYIFGQGYGAQLALSLALGLSKVEHLGSNLKGVVLNNGIISPAATLSKLGFYLEELGYIDDNGRAAIENYSNETKQLVDEGKLGEAFENFLSLDDFVNENAGAVAVNLGHIVEKLTHNSAKGVFGQKQYLQDVTGFNLDFNKFMTETVAPALNISGAAFDSRRDDVTQAFKEDFMKPATNKVEEILKSTNLTLTIVNGNLDGISNTPGQFEWINALQWSGLSDFFNQLRLPLVVNGLIQGYHRQTDRLKFYWVNAAGLSIPLDSPAAMRRVMQIIVGN